jgi:hypothetical protein
MNSAGLTIIIAALAIIFPKNYNMLHKQNLPGRNHRTEWIIASLIQRMPDRIKIEGNPEIVTTSYGKAASFNGSSDGIFVDSMPLTGLNKFTIEIIFKPQSGGNFEQRFLHCGEPQGDRVLLELRSTASGWYFDAFIKVGNQQLALIDPNLLHPNDQWYHLAYIVDNGKLETYVNGKLELEGSLTLSPLKDGKTSIGVRQNEVSWFRGAIYSIRFTGRALTPDDFMKFRN